MIGDNERAALVAELRKAIEKTDAKVAAALEESKRQLAQVEAMKAERAEDKATIAQLRADLRAMEARANVCGQLIKDVFYELNPNAARRPDRDHMQMTKTVREQISERRYDTASDFASAARRRCPVTDTCTRCGRVNAADMMDDADVRCFGGTRCDAVRAAYLRGIDDGVRLAKETP